MELLTVFAFTGLFMGIYLAIGYVMAIGTIALHKSKRYPFLDDWYAGYDYSNEVAWWPLTAFAIIVERFCKLWMAVRRLIKRLLAKTELSFLSPEAVATKVVSRNQMTILQSGEESHDG